MASKGCVITQEHREKIRKALTGRKYNQQTRDFMSRAARLRSRDENGKFDYECMSFEERCDAARELGSLDF